MKTLVFALALTVAAPIALHAQVVIQTPDPYWRQHQEHQEWRRWDEHAEHRAEQHREEWRHGHCVRDRQNVEYCR